MSVTQVLDKMSPEEIEKLLELCEKQGVLNADGKVDQDALEKFVAEYSLEGDKLKKEAMYQRLKVYRGMRASLRSKKAADKATTPEAAKNIFDAYKKKHPATTKKWQDFFEKAKKETGEAVDKATAIGKDVVKTLKKIPKAVKVKSMKKSLNKLKKHAKKIDKAFTKASKTASDKFDKGFAELKETIKTDPAKGYAQSAALVGGAAVAALAIGSLGVAAFMGEGFLPVDEAAGMAEDFASNLIEAAKGGATGASTQVTELASSFSAQMAEGMTSAADAQAATGKFFRDLAEADAGNATFEALSRAHDPEGYVVNDALKAFESATAGSSGAIAEAAKQAKTNMIVGGSIAAAGTVVGGLAVAQNLKKKRDDNFKAAAKADPSNTKLQDFVKTKIK